MCIFFTEEEETEDKDYRDENELSGGEEPEWEADERSSEAANDTGVEDSLQDTSGDKEDQLESESVSAASRTLRLSELKANLVRTCDRKKLGVVLERLSEVRRRMALCSKEKVELGVTTLLFLSCFYVFSRKTIFPSVTSAVRMEVCLIFYYCTKLVM